MSKPLNPDVQKRSRAERHTYLPWHKFPALPEHLQSIIDDQSLPLDERLIQLMAEALRPQADAHDPDTLAADASLHEFVKQAWHVLEPNAPFKDGWHIQCVCAHLEAVNKLQIRDLVINIPPRHGKSLIVSVFWFVWTWLREPWTRWLYTSYAASLSERDSDKCRTLIRSAWFQERWPTRFQIKPKQDTVTKFVNDREGHRIATSVGGVGTGEGGDHLIGDDPHKTDEILSVPALERVIQNWDQTLSTRGNDPSTTCKVIVMQRLGERDLTGHVLEECMGYQALILPAEYEPARYFFPDPATPNQKPPKDSIQWTTLQRETPRWRDSPEGSGRFEEGQLLWPEQFNQAALRKLKAELRAVGTAGQLQQRPSPQTGVIFKSQHFKYTSEQHSAQGLLIILDANETGQGPAFYASTCRWFQTCDTALKIKTTSAWTVCTTFCVTPNRRLIVWDVWRERLLVPEQYAALRQLRQGRGLWEPEVRQWLSPGSANPWPCPLLYQAVEDKASGIGLIQQAIMDGQPFRVLKADQDKVRRAAPLATLFEAGLVYFRGGNRPTWLTDLEDELKSFPRGAYDDQVDTLSYGAQLFTRDSLTNSIDGDLVVDGGSASILLPHDDDPQAPLRNDLNLDNLDEEGPWGDSWWRK